MILKHAPFYDGYVDSVHQKFPIALIEQKEEIHLFLKKLDASKLHYSYSAGKWMLKEVLLHCLDVERIMSIRILMISRGEKNNLLGFNENEYVSKTVSDFIKLSDIVTDFSRLRDSTISLFNMLPDQSLKATGLADGEPISIASLWHIIVGHWNHHMEIINDRYL